MTRRCNLSPWSARRLLAAATLLWGLGAAAPALALECPTPEPGSRDVLRESSAQIAGLSALLGSGDLDNRIPIILDALRRRHPTAGTSEIVNYLVTAYCPVVAARDDLDEAAKRSVLDTFSSQVATLAARP